MTVAQQYPDELVAIAHAVRRKVEAQHEITAAVHEARAQGYGWNELAPMLNVYDLEPRERPL